MLCVVCCVVLSVGCCVLCVVCCFLSVVCCVLCGFVLRVLFFVCCYVVGGAGGNVR